MQNISKFGLSERGFLPSETPIKVIDSKNSAVSNISELTKSMMKNNKTVDENLVALIAKIGEKITIGRSRTLQNKDSRNFTYQHSTIKDNVSKLGVIVSIKADEKNEQFNLLRNLLLDLLCDIAQFIAYRDE